MQCLSGTLLNLSSARYCTRAHWTSRFLQGTKHMAGRVELVILDHSITLTDMMAIINFFTSNTFLAQSREIWRAGYVLASKLFWPLKRDIY